MLCNRSVKPGHLMETKRLFFSLKLVCVSSEKRLNADLDLSVQNVYAGPPVSVPQTRLVVTVCRGQNRMGTSAVQKECISEGRFYHR